MIISDHCRIRWEVQHLTMIIFSEIQWIWSCCRTGRWTTRCQIAFSDKNSWIYFQNSRNKICLKYLSTPTTKLFPALVNTSCASWCDNGIVGMSFIRTTTSPTRIPASSATPPSMTCRSKHNLYNYCESCGLVYKRKLFHKEKLALIHHSCSLLILVLSCYYLF